MVEQRTLNPSVQSSSLCAPTRFQPIVINGGLFSFLHSLQSQTDPFFTQNVVFARLFSFCLSLCVVGLVSTLCRADTLTEISSQLIRRPILTANYVAEKKTPRIPVPLISRGALVISDNHGLIWKTQSPFVSLNVFTDTHVGTLNAQNRWDSRPQRHLRPYLDQIKCIVSGQFESLGEHFLLDLHLDTSTGRWSVIAVPKNDRIQTMLKEIAFFGTGYVERILITQSNGDTTRIVFDNFAHPDFLTKDDQHLFEKTR